MNNSHNCNYDTEIIKLCGFMSGILSNEIFNNYYNLAEINPEVKNCIKSQQSRS